MQYTNDEVILRTDDAKKKELPHVRINKAIQSIDYTHDELVAALVYLVRQQGIGNQLDLGSVPPTDERLTIGYIDGDMIITVLPKDSIIIGRDVLGD